MYERDFATGVKRIIETQGFKQKAIAEKSKIAPEAFSKALNGKRRLFADEAYAISKALNMSIEEIVELGKNIA